MTLRCGTVAALAGVVSAPTVRGAGRREAACERAVVAVTHRGESEPASNGDGDETARGCAVAELTPPVLAPTIGDTDRGDSAGMVSGCAQSREAISGGHRNRHGAGGVRDVVVIIAPTVCRSADCKTAGGSTASAHRGELQPAGDQRRHGAARNVTNNVRAIIGCLGALAQP